MDSTIYRRDAGWRWVVSGTIGSAERAAKLAAHLAATLLPLSWRLRGDLDTGGPLHFGDVALPGRLSLARRLKGDPASDNEG